MTTLESLAQEYVGAVKRMDALTARCLALCGDDGDRAAYYIHDDFTFTTGSKAEQDLILTNPFDAAFYGKRLDLYLDRRLVDESGAGNSELTFRPVDWTATNDVGQPSLVAFKDVNAVFTVRTPDGSYSNAPLAISHAFSARQGVYKFTPVSAYLGGLDFHRDYVVPRGEAMTVRVSSIYTKALEGGGKIPDDTSVPEYRVTAVLQGYKRVRAFR